MEQRITSGMIYRNHRKVLIYKPCMRNKPSVFFLKKDKVSSVQPVSETPVSNQSGLPSMRTDLIDKFEFKARITIGRNAGPRIFQTGRGVRPPQKVDTPTIIWQFFRKPENMKMIEIGLRRGTRAQYPLGSNHWSHSKKGSNYIAIYWFL